MRWLGLQVRRHLVTGVDTALVEFVARKAAQVAATKRQRPEKP